MCTAGPTGSSLRVTLGPPKSSTLNVSTSQSSVRWGTVSSGRIRSASSRARAKSNPSGYRAKAWNGSRLRLFSARARRSLRSVPRSGSRPAARPRSHSSTAVFFAQPFTSSDGSSGRGTQSAGTTIPHVRMSLTAAASRPPPQRARHRVEGLDHRIGDLYEARREGQQQLRPRTRHGQLVVQRDRGRASPSAPARPRLRNAVPAARSTTDASAASDARPGGSNVTSSEAGTVNAPARCMPPARPPPSLRCTHGCHAPRVLREDMPFRPRLSTLVLPMPPVRDRDSQRPHEVLPAIVSLRSCKPRAPRQKRPRLTVSAPELERVGASGL